MIIDISRFINEEREYWTELEGFLDKLEKDPSFRMDLGQIKRFHYLYQRASADTARIKTFSSEKNLRQYLESLVGRAFGYIHETGRRPRKIALLNWFFNTFPQTFRKHIQAFLISALITVTGCVFGGAAVGLDTQAKPVLIPFEHLQKTPSERVAMEESMDKDTMKGHKARFSSYLMTHNTRVSIFIMVLGISWGIGTIIMLFYNGVILGAIAVDYIMDGQLRFLAGWLLPHGSIEIPAILIAGQAGLVIAGTLVGRGEPVSVRQRFRDVSRDILTLIAGVAVLLIWAGLVESYLSQYHQPVISYELKITLGVFELLLLTLFLWKSGRKTHADQHA